MTYFNRIKDVSIHLPPIHGNFGGEFLMRTFQGVEFPRGSGTVYEIYGTERINTGWMPNLITDQGLDMYGLDSFQFGADYCHVGTDNSAPANGDTSLGAWVAAIGYTSKIYGAQGTPPYFGHATVKYRFNPGFAGGGNVNLNEVGVGSTAINGSLSSHALTVDAMGDPVTVPVLSNEYLEVYYKRRNYPAHLVEATGAPTDDSAQILVSGLPYTYTIRPINVTYAGVENPQTNWGWGPGALGTAIPWRAFNQHNTFYGMAGTSTCTLGAVTSTLSAFQATMATTDTDFNGSYSTGSYSRSLKYEWGIDNANGVGGIGGLVVKTAMGAYQMTFNTPIPKVVGEVLTWFHTFTWDRKNTWV